MMVVRRLVAAPLSLTLGTSFRVAVSKRSGPCFSAPTFLVANTPLGNCVADEGRARIAFGYFAHSPFRINRFKRQDTSVTESVQFGGVSQKSDSFAVCTHNPFALEFLKCRCIAGFEIFVDGNPIIRKQRGLARITERNLASPVPCRNDKDA
jgi:hypothetical protein